MSQSEPVHSPNLANLFSEIGKLRPEQVAGKPLDPKLALLRQWQAERLARTYADLTSQPRYQAAMRFFLDDVYGARDFSQRNHDIEQIYDLLRHIAPEALIRPLVLTVQLHYLTEELDQQLLDVLVQRLGLEDTITVALYAEAYRLCDNYQARLRQIDLLYEIGKLLDSGVRMPFSGAVLGLAKNALQHAGWADMMAFMERGYKAFKRMRGAKELLNTIRTRETRILDRIYAQDPDPFKV
jgi:hypothetical protein